MKRLNIAFLLLVLIMQQGFSQQDPLSSHYMFNTMTFNPGIAGISGMICATAINRQQWIGFEGAPSTTIFNISTPVKPFGVKSGVGLLIESDNIGFDKDINLSGIYSYHTDIGRGKLGIGLNLGMLNKTLTPAWQIPDGDAHTPASGDPLIPENKESYVAFDAGFGLYYKAEKYYAAISVTHLNQPKIKFSKGQPYISRHYYLTAGYTFQLQNPSFELAPSVFAFSDGKVAQFTVTSLLRYNKKVWGGVSYRAGDALTGILGIELYNGIRLGYAYDFTISDIRKNSSGSHEFMVNYCFDMSLGKSPMKYKSIRFL
ncbi:MAG TPA: type IX secretion system membrane protein PorP/SprF [Bacteroidales bacterium]|nr:type IX secretion system membrane protein PorP/SprF [Bacteroidales bacterium]